MAKTTPRSRRRRAGPTLEERMMRSERQILERGRRHQRKLRELARALQRETASADAALRDVGIMVMQRETPVERVERVGDAIGV